MIGKKIKKLRISNGKLLWLSVLLLTMVVEAVYLLKDHQTRPVEASNAQQEEVLELNVTP